MLGTWSSNFLFDPRFTLYLYFILNNFLVISKFCSFGMKNNWKDCVEHNGCMALFALRSRGINRTGSITRITEFLFVATSAGVVIDSYCYYLPAWKFFCGIIPKWPTERQCAFVSRPFFCDWLEILCISHWVGGKKLRGKVGTLVTTWVSRPLKFDLSCYGLKFDPQYSLT